ncbi:DUF1161 domain-containing protein [Rhodanobacter caeni]|uniref:DUF1161 domain-containing protein n=1 Tax=Rhodanobacter caeni TaxID=657654 RepID=A0ABN0UN28_9GAMM
MNMRIGLGILALALLPLLAHASCDSVKANIDARIKANGVADYTLAVVPAGQEPASGKVVGHCEGDQQIVYTRGAAASSMGDSAAKPAMPMNDGNASDSEPSPSSTAGH